MAKYLMAKENKDPNVVEPSWFHNNNDDDDDDNVEMADIEKPTAAPASASDLEVNSKKVREGDYEIVLLIDIREDGKTLNRGITERLRARKVKCDGRVLVLGDFVWIARPKSSSRPVFLY